VVYKGEHTVTGQTVAVKVLPPELALHKEVKLRFVEEARALALLEHPNIVNLINFTQDREGRVCLMMQFVEGVTWEKMIQDAGKMDPREAVRIAIEVCKALEYAHSHGVVHRDMKPSNVLVRTDGVVKVTDFGIAKIVGSTRLTEQGQTMGTVRYMSPEQVRGKEVDARSDIYSLGATLYEALAGDTPFTGDTHFEIMQKHLAEPAPSLRQAGIEASGDLEEVILCSLAKRVEGRFADAASFRAALECVPEGARPGTARRPALPAARRRKRSKGWTVGLGLAALGAAGVAGVLLLRKPPPAPVVKKPPPAAPAWPPPHALLRTVQTAVDEKFADLGVRIISTSARDPKPLADAVVHARAILPAFLKGEGVTAEVPMRPLNLAIVPQALLNRPDLWPDSKAGTDYPSRYEMRDATLYVADVKGFETRELPGGLALHMLAPVKQLSNEQVYDLADRFERYYSEHAK
jgi:serine/threonine protein kinase